MHSIWTNTEGELRMKKKNVSQLLKFLMHQERTQGLAVTAGRLEECAWYHLDFMADIFRRVVESCLRPMAGEVDKYHV